MKKRIVKWTGWRATVKTMCFLLVLALVLGRAGAVLALKGPDGIYQMRGLYAQGKNSVDVLAVGSSHVFYDINPGTLWDEYGLAVYDLGSAYQLPWTSYYSLKEALKSQTPKLVVLEGYMLYYRQEYLDAYWTPYSIDGMRWSGDKAEAIRHSVPPDERSGYFLSYTRYHDRSRYLSREDFLGGWGDSARYGNWKGYFYAPRRKQEQVWPEGVQTGERIPLAAKTEEWYRKTIELARSAGVPLIIVVNPYPGVTAEQQAIFNTASDIAGEYGVPFVNFNRDFTALDLDPTLDFCDGSHMNVWGSRKFSCQLGKFLTERYDLPDRRGDPAYQSWEESARYIAAYTRDAELSLGVSPAAALLLDSDYTCAVGVSGSGGTAFAPLLEALGVPAGEEGLWLSSGGAVSWSSGPEGTEYFRLNYHDLKLSRTGGINAMVFDKGAVEQARDGVTIFVYDSVTQAEAARLIFGTT